MKMGEREYRGEGEGKKRGRGGIEGREGKEGKGKGTGEGKEGEGKDPPLLFRQIEPWSLRNGVEQSPRTSLSMRKSSTPGSGIPCP